MAGKIHDEQLNVDININGNKAKKELYGLEKSERSLLETQKLLRLEKAKLTKENAHGTVAWKLLSQEIKENNTKLSQNKTKQTALRKEIGVTGLTTRQLARETKRLKAIMSNFTPNSPQWNKYNSQLQKVDGQLQKVKFQMKGTSGVISKMNRRFSNFGGVLASLGIYKVIEGVKRLTTVNAELSESQTDVKKTTGLSDKEIQKLTKNLKKLDTRTPINGLLGIAEEAGRLGKKGVKDIQEFVTTADKIAVSLGDDLQGEIADNIRLIGKLADNYKVSQKENVNFAKGLEKVGSAINEVSANGSANAGFMVDYLKRLVGISKQTDITAQAQIGYAAVLDESGQSVEVAGTTMSKVMFDMFGDTSTYAKIAGVDIKKFTKLMNTDANEAFLLFLEGLNGNNGGLQEMSGKLKDLGLNGARSISVLTTLAGETDKVREKQTLANKALKENTSLSTEFQEKNTNLPALLEKIGNTIQNKFTGSGFQKFFKGIAKGFLSIISPADNLIKKIKEEQIELNVLVNRITDTNIKTEDRKKLLKEMQEKYPFFLKNLKAEKISNRELSTAIKEVNLLYIKRIALQTQQSRIEKIIGKAGENAFKTVKNKISLDTKLAEINRDVLKNALDLTNSSTKDNITIISQAIKQSDGYLNARSRNGVSIGKEADALRKLTAIQTHYNGTIGRGKNLTNLLTDEKRLLSEMEKELGTTVEGINKIFSLSTKPTTPPDNTPDSDPDSDPDPSNPIKTTKQKAEEELTAFIKKQKEQRLLDGKEGIEKELAYIDLKYAAQIEKANANHLSTKELEAQRDLEKQELLLQRQLEFKEKLAEIEGNENLTKEEKEIAKVEVEFEKHTNDLLLLQLNKEEETALLEKLELAEKIAIDKIKEKFQKKELKDLEAQRKKKLKLNNDIVNSAIDLAGRETRVGQGLLAIKGILAAKESLINLGILKTKIATTTAGATVDIKGGMAKTASVGFPQNIPLIIGFAAQVAGIVSAIKSAASSVPGYEDGLYDRRYPVTRTDGKKFNAKLGTTKTGLVTEPTLMDGKYLAGERSTARNPEMIIDDITFAKLDPKVINYIQDVHLGRSPGYENGKYDTTTSNNNQSPVLETDTTAETDGRLINILKRLENALEGGIEAKAIIGYPEIDKITDLQKEIEESSNNGIVK